MTNVQLSDESSWPRFCCAILRDQHGRYLLEKRSQHDDHMPGQLVCFGGGRDPGEHPDACVRRELIEEIGSAPDQLELCVKLVGTSGKLIALFYRGRAPAPSSIIVEQGVEAIWARPEELSSLPIGHWNLAAILAEKEGREIAIVKD